MRTRSHFILKKVHQIKFFAGGLLIAKSQALTHLRCAGNDYRRKRGNSIRVYSGGTVGLTDQQTAFTDAQSSMLQSGDFNLRVGRALNIPYSRS